MNDIRDFELYVDEESKTIDESASIQVREIIKLLEEDEKSTGATIYCGEDENIKYKIEITKVSESDMQ